MGQGHPIAQTLDRLSLLFISLSALELAVNAFAHWLRPFVRCPWNLLDAAVLAASLASAAARGQAPGLVISLRALRVLRVFGKIKALRNIVSSLAVALPPVLGVFSILLLVSIGAPASHA